MSLALSIPQIALSLAAGGLTTLSPCVFPLLPLVLGGGLQRHRLAPVAMGVGMTTTFAALGMALGALGPALTLVASEGGVARGGGVLGVFGLGAAVPLVAVAYASRSGFLRARGWVLAHAEQRRYGFAVLIGAMGIAILTGGDRWLETRFVEWMPEAWVNLTVGI